MTLSELVYHRNQYAANQNVALYLVAATLILTAVFPYAFYPVTYVFGIIAAIGIMSVSNLSYFIAIRKAFKRYKTSGLVSYKMATLLGAYWWLALGLMIIGTSLIPTVGIMTSKVIIFVMLMYCIYIESEVMISDNEVFPVKVGGD
jgi:hypothetical protein